MQFYIIIEDDPEENAKELPDYCLKDVNIREGWQIISDIGHAMGVRWPGQNKEYNRYHAETRKHWENLASYNTFIHHYQACLEEYERRFKDTFKKTPVWFQRFRDFLYYADYLLKIEFLEKEKLPKRWQIIEYLTTNKAPKLKADELRKLKNMIGKE